MKFIDDAIKESEQRMEENTPDNISSDIDEELIGIMKGVKTNIYVVGAGGAGNNTISRLNEMGIEGATTIAVRKLTILTKVRLFLIIYFHLFE